MSERLHLSLIPSEDGFDGVAFSAQINDVREVGTIGRTTLVKWALAPDEPLEAVFIREQEKIKPVVSEWMKSQPGTPIRLSEFDF